MNVAHPARCLFCRGVSAPSRRVVRHAMPATASPSRHFSVSPPKLARKKPAHPSLSTASLETLSSTSVSRLSRYTPDEKARLSKKYTPAQIAALEAGEDAIDPEDLISQGMVRTDHMSLRYLDDFSTIRPVIDHPVRNPESNYDPNLRAKTEEELDEDFAKFYRDFPEDTPEEEVRLKWMQFVDNVRLTVGKEEAERAPRSYLSAPLPKISDPDIVYSKTEAFGADPQMNRVLLQTGFDERQVKDFKTKILVSHRVVNQTRMGKKQSMYFLACAGNGNGLLGIGEGKADEPEDAKRQAVRAAIRNMTAVPRYEDRTIFGEVEQKVGATIVRLSSRPPGFGVRCQQYIFEMCRAAGITDLSGRVIRSRNPMNVAKATFAALRGQRIPDEIARARGKKLVDVRKVYYAGNV